VRRLILRLLLIGLALLMTILGSVPAQASSDHTDWAILIAGGYDAANNRVRYWNDISEMYEILTDEYDYATDHIFVLYADGQRLGQGNYEEYDPDEDDLGYPTPGTPGINFLAATLDNLDSVTDTIAGSSCDSDTVFVFTTDHGDFDGSLYLWGEAISPETFASYDYMGKIERYAWRAFEMEQCYSGAFVQPLSGPRTAIATACRAGEPSYGGVAPHEMYDEFCFYFNAALKGAEPDSVGGTAVDADVNDDGRVSFAEAFNYAQANDFWAQQDWEHPQFDDNGDGISHEGQMPAGGDGLRRIGIRFGLIMGRVGNADTGFPLPYSLVTIEGPVDQQVETDYDGRYAIFGLTPGAYTVTASHMGCGNGYYSFVQLDIEFRTRNFMLDPLLPGPIPYRIQRT
jgi:hypothetical protein